MHALPLMPVHAALALRDRALALEFAEGSATARGPAKEVKSNLQARRSDPGYAAIADEVRNALADDARVRDLAFPKRISRPLVNRYEAGGAYGLHVDSALMGGVTDPIRTDLSFTLFLTPPDEYEGGDLQVQGESGMRTFREEPGTVVIYPTHALHQVTAVTAGSRVSVVGWIESWVADPVYRALMTKLRQVQGAVDEGTVTAVTRLVLAEVTEGLLRHGSR